MKPGCGRGRQVLFGRRASGPVAVGGTVPSVALGWLGRRRPKRRNLGRAADGRPDVEPRPDRGPVRAYRPSRQAVHGRGLLRQATADLFRTKAITRTCARPICSRSVSLGSRHERYVVCACVLIPTLRLENTSACRFRTDTSNPFRSTALTGISRRLGRRNGSFPDN
jgi:hypothetical protein